MRIYTNWMKASGVVQLTWALSRAGVSTFPGKAQVENIRPVNGISDERSSCGVVSSGQQKERLLTVAANDV